MPDSKTKYVPSFGKGRKGRRLQLTLARASTNATMEDVAPAEHVNVVDVVDTVESTDTVTDSGVVTDAGETRHSPVIVSQVLFTFFLVTTVISCA